MTEQATRQSILDFVGSHPASSGRAIQRGLQLAWGETDYHLNRLTKAGLLRRQKEGKSHHYFLPDFPLVEAPLMRAMQGHVGRAILVILARTDGLPFTRLAEQVGESKSVVAFHLKSLEARGLVAKNSDQKPIIYRVKEPQMVLHIYGAFAESFEDRWLDLVSSTFGGLLKE